MVLYKFSFQIWKIIIIFISLGQIFFVESEFYLKEYFGIDSEHVWSLFNLHTYK